MGGETTGSHPSIARPSAQLGVHSRTGTECGHHGAARVTGQQRGQHVTLHNPLKRGPREAVGCLS
jgi:hypothetical protein